MPPDVKPGMDQDHHESKVEDDFVKIQVASNMELRVQKSAVGATLPKGTLKSLDEA